MKKTYTVYITKNWLNASLVTGIDTFIQISEKEEFELSIEPIKNKRSSAQNRLYWSAIIGGFIELAPSLDTDKIKFSDWTKEDFHNVLKEKFLRERDPKLKRFVTRSTTDLTTKEMSEYIDKCIDFLVSKGGTITDEYKDLYRQSKED